jgi:NADH-quinone oxidoreductase subunit N
MNSSDLLTIAGPLVCGLGAVVLMLIDLGVAITSKSTTGWIAAIIMALAAAAAATQSGASASTSGFSGMVVSDGYAIFFDVLLAVIGIITVILTLRYNEARGIMRGEFYPLMLFALAGMMLMGHSTNLIMIFVAVELLSIPLYVLCGIARPKTASEESALKYFLLGAFASGFLVYGIALVYGAAGTTSLQAITSQLNGRALDSTNPLLLAGVALILVGLGFKVAAVPFHMWTPDVYEGAPTTVTAFMTTATKAAGFAAILRVFMFGLAPIASEWQTPIVAMAVLSMLVGNVVALAQTNLKRMLAYSSIAHAGYVLAGVASANDEGATAVMFYLASYAITSLAAFAVMTALNSGTEGENQALDAYAGLGRRKPLLALVMAVSMLSLLGIPPTTGFFGKYFLINAVTQSGLTPIPYYLLLFTIVLTSVISAGFYLRVLMTMYMRDSNADQSVPTHMPRSIAALVTTVFTLIAGLLSSPMLDLISNSVKSIAR